MDKVRSLAPRDQKGERQAALERAVADIEKRFGRGSIMRLGEANAILNVEVIPTGCLPLDLALAVGGLPRGRIVEIFGPESSGKTTVALHVIAEAQKQGRHRRLYRRRARPGPNVREKPGRGSRQPARQPA